MRLKLKTRSVIVTCVAAIALAAGGSVFAQVAPIGATGTFVAIPGVPNAGSVTGNLFRGAQPKDSAYAALQKLGMNIVVDLRGENGEVSSEKKEVESLG